MKFNPCIGKCTEAGTHCEGCGRSHEEISEVAELVNGLVTHAKKKDFENPEEFAHFIEHSIMYHLQPPE